MSQAFDLNRELDMMLDIIFWIKHDKPGLVIRAGVSSNFESNRDGNSETFAILLG